MITILLLHGLCSPVPGRRTQPPGCSHLAPRPVGRAPGRRGLRLCRRAHRCMHDPSPSAMCSPWCWATWCMALSGGRQDHAVRPAAVALERLVRDQGTSGGAGFFCWRPIFAVGRPQDAAQVRSRRLLTTVLAAIVWYAPLAGHLLNNLEGVDLMEHTTLHWGAGRWPRWWLGTAWHPGLFQQCHAVLLLPMVDEWHPPRRGAGAGHYLLWLENHRPAGGRRDPCCCPLALDESPASRYGGSGRAVAGRRRLHPREPLVSGEHFCRCAPSPHALAARCGRGRRQRGGRPCAAALASRASLMAANGAQCSGSMK